MIDSKQSSKDFFNDIDRHIENMQHQEYKEVTRNYKNGRKLYLEVVVEDGEMCSYLHKWLYGKDQRPFGCRLEAIHYNNPSNSELRQQLIELANTL